MKILVTGGAGFIASHVVDTYIAHGHEVVIIDDLSTGRASNLNPAATFYHLDIRSPEIEKVFQQERPQVINHHAAQMDVRRSVREPIFDADVNIGGSLNLLECVRRYGVGRFIYISTGGAVYGEPVYLPCDEAHPIDPICQYGASKHTVEHYLYMYKENYDLDYVVLRYPNVYGPRQDRNGEAGVVAIFSGQMLNGEQVVINGDGEQERDFVYVEDCARANLIALKKGAGIYNIGSGQGTTVNQIFEGLRMVTNYQKPAEYGPAKLGETQQIYLDAAHASRELGWKPSVSLQEGLRRTVHSLGLESELRPLRLIEVSQTLDREQPVGRKHSSNGHGQSDTVWDALFGIDKDSDGKATELEKLVDQATQALQATSGTGFLLDEYGRLESAALIYEDQRWEQPQAMESLKSIYAKGLAGWAILNRKAALLPRASDDARWLRSNWEKESGDPRSVICIPLIQGSEVKGALTIVRRGPEAFGDLDLALLLTIVGMYSLNESNQPAPISELIISEEVQQ